MNDSNSSSQENVGKPRLPSQNTLRIFALLVGMEALLVTAGAVYFLTLTFTEVTTNIAGAIVIFLITLIVAVGLWVSTFAIFRGKSWSRGIVITWQVIQFALATSFIQGIVEWRQLGWLIFGLSIGTFAIYFWIQRKTYN